MVKFGPRSAIFRRPVFFHVLDHLESIGKFFFQQKFWPEKTLKNFVIYRDGRYDDVIAINLKIFWAKIFADIFFGQSTSNGPKCEKKTGRRKIAVRGPNLTIFPCVGTQTKYRFRVSGYLDQK